MFHEFANTCSIGFAKREQERRTSKLRGHVKWMGRKSGGRCYGVSSVRIAHSRLIVNGTMDKRILRGISRMCECSPDSQSEMCPPTAREKAGSEAPRYASNWTKDGFDACTLALCWPLRIQEKRSDWWSNSGIKLRILEIIERKRCQSSIDDNTLTGHIILLFVHD